MIAGMADFDSFTKHEHKIIHHYRDQLNHAESVEDVRKFFVYAVRELCGLVFEDRVNVDYEDVQLKPQSASGFSISSRLKNRAAFRGVWGSSDLKHIIGRLAESARHRFRHLETSPEKTRLKIKGH
jgi:hypothetical protein